MKNIVICCDETGNEYGRNNTNVVETCALVEKDRDQVAWYDPGVGTGGWEYEEEKGGPAGSAARQARGFVANTLVDPPRRAPSDKYGSDCPRAVHVR